MTISYSDGRTVGAVLLSRTETTLRVAIEGAEDVMEVSDVNGTWVSADCEPVSIEFAWQRHDRKKAISVDDCCCSHELAARLIHLLFTDSSEDNVEMGAPQELRMAAGSLHLTI